MITAALHIVGVLVALAVAILGSGIIDGYFNQRRLERILEAASMKLDLPRQGILAGEHNAQIAHYLADRYDADRIVNRISDVGWLAFLALECFSYAAQLAVVAVAGWFAFTKDPAYAASAWFALMIPVAHWGLIVVTSVFLYVVTGRAPGEARDARSLSARLRKEDGLNPTNSSN